MQPNGLHFVHFPHIYKLNTDRIIFSHELQEEEHTQDEKVNNVKKLQHKQESPTSFFQGKIKTINNMGRKSSFTKMI